MEELNAQLVSLVGENGAELLVGALKSRRSISGPEMDVKYAVSITAVKTCFVANSEIIHSTSKSDGTAVFGIILKRYQIA